MGPKYEKPNWGKTNILSRNYQEFDVWKMWMLWKMRFWKCNFFLKNETLKMWILWKMRLWKCEFWENETLKLWIFGWFADFCHSVITMIVSEWNPNSWRDNNTFHPRWKILVPSAVLAGTVVKVSLESFHAFHLSNFSFSIYGPLRNLCLR